MKLIINENVYLSPKWDVSNGKGTLKLETNDSFSVLSELFEVASGTQIIQTSDEDNAIGIWYVQSLESIEILEENGVRNARIVYLINTLPEDMKTAIDADIEESTDAIFELAGIVDETKRLIKNTEQLFEERDQRLGGQDEQLSHFREVVEGFELRMNAFADRIANLENMIGG